MTKEEELKRKYAINFHEKTGYKKPQWTIDEARKIVRKEIVPDPILDDGIETIGSLRKKKK